MSRLSLPLELEPVRAKLEAAVLPCVVLSPAPGDAEGRGTHTGGAPWLAPGAEWPTTENGPMSFLGQLDFRELASAGGTTIGLPSDGVLSVFFDFQSPPRGDRADDRKRWAVVYSPGLTTQIEPPAGVTLAPCEPLTPHAALSLPDPSDLAVLSFAHAPRLEPWFEPYEDFVSRFAMGQGPMPPFGGVQQQVGGYADWNLGDGRPMAQIASRGWDVDEGNRPDPMDPAVAREAREWMLLWQLRPQPDDLTWIDLGTLYVLLRREDLSRRAFGRAWLVYQPS